MDREPSKTAERVALQRAVHQLIDAFPKILEDPISPRLFTPPVIADVNAHPERFQTPSSLALRSHVLIRSRYAEDRLMRAALQGVQQYLILGAGWDTFAYRQPEWAHGLHIFEVDHPASQQAKVQRLHSAEIVVPANVEYVPVDFETTSLRDGLRNSSFDFTGITYISWLGVLVYLTQEAIDAVVHFAASLPRGSELVLTFSTPPRDQQPHPLAEVAGQLGEPWKTYFTPDALIAYFHRFGFTVLSIPTADEIAARYFATRQDGLFASRRTNLAHVKVENIAQ
ncbi:MAG: class I SAM-dependent methyltransferase [Ktedonobacterales bacterium]